MLVPITLSISVFAPILAFIISINNVKVKDIWKICFTCSLAIGFTCMLLFIFSYDKFFSEPKTWLLNGIVVSGEYIEEAENGSEISVVKSYFSPQEEINKNYLGLIDLSVLVCIIGSTAVSIYFLPNNNDKTEFVSENEKDFLIPSIVVATSLFICLLPMPYWYYNIVRFLVMLSFGYLASQERKQHNFPLWAIFVFIAIVFNPISIITFTRIVWNIIDIITAMVLFSYSIKKYIDLKN